MSNTTTFDRSTTRQGLYDEAVSWCHQVIQSRDELLFDPQAFHDGVSNAAKTFNYTFESIDSLLRHVHLQHVKKWIYRIRANISNYIHRYCRDGKSILSLSREANYPPYMMARIFVEHMHVKYNTNQKSKGGSRKYVTNAMRDPKHFLAREDINSILRPEYVNSELVGALGVNSANEEISIDPFSLLPITATNTKGMTRIAREVIQCINKDPLYGPRHDKQRRVIGLEHEIMLEQALHALGIPFESEADLRIKGTSRTPDILLSYPVGIKVPVIHNNPKIEIDANESSEWRTICWIDSKAMFGDVNTHHAETLPQAEAFVHRFGPGLIIYWYGHAPIERLSDGYGDVSVLAWNAPSCIMLPTGEFRHNGAKYPSFTSK